MVPNSLTQNFSQIGLMVMTLLTFLCNPNPNPNPIPNANPNPNPNPRHNPNTLYSMFYNNNIGHMQFTFCDLMY